MERKKEFEADTEVDSRDNEMKRRKERTREIHREKEIMHIFYRE